MKRTMHNSVESRLGQWEDEDSNRSHKKLKLSDTTKDVDSTTLEYCPNQSLAKHIKSHKGVGLPENDVKGFATDILFGLKYIHGKKMIHCNIKPKNILLTPETKKRIRSNGFTAKITGLENAIQTDSDEYGEGWGLMRGTTRFLAPELIIRDSFLDYGADVWAFGCTVLEMLTGERVWSEHTGELVWEDWIELIGESDTVPYVSDSVSREAKDFVYKCLEKDPDLRLSVDGLLEHPFLIRKDDEEEEEEEEVYEEEEEEEEYEGIHGVYVDVYEYGPYLEEEEEEEVEEEQEEIEIDEEYPREDPEEAEDL